MKDLMDQKTGKVKPDKLSGVKKNCTNVVEVEENGYCQCGGGRIVITGQCHNPSLSVKTTCERVCQRGPSPYELLGTHRWASDETIKKNFRKLSLQHHPDKAQDGGKRFGQIRQAMDIIGEADSKIIFDMGAYELYKKFRDNKLQKGDETRTKLRVSLEQLYNGAMMRPTLSRKKICPGCTLKSKSPYCTETCKATCHPTHETRVFWQGNMQFHNQVEVPSNKKCRNDRQPFDLSIEKGMKDGEEIKF